MAQKETTLNRIIRKIKINSEKMGFIYFKFCELKRACWIWKNSSWRSLYGRWIKRD